jgi:hypothetical protein
MWVARGFENAEPYFRNQCARTPIAEFFRPVREFVAQQSMQQVQQTDAGRLLAKAAPPRTSPSPGFLVPAAHSDKS